MDDAASDLCNKQRSGVLASITSGNTQAPVYMIREKAAQMIWDNGVNSSNTSRITPPKRLIILLIFGLVFYS